MLDLHEVPSPLGPLVLASRGDALVGLHLPGSTSARPSGAACLTAILDRAATQLAEYFAGTRTAFELALVLEGTEFQRRVWEALCAIPFGVTCSYQAIAKAIGQPTAARAVGAANHRNPIAIIVPCHRVIGADASLTGYGGGMAAKQLLLAHEKARGTQLVLGGLA